jgi:anaerobic selenocysteine-containing dehydrogenase
MPPDAGREGRRIVRGACPHDCPDTCATLVTVENGRAIAIRGADDHPPTQGTLCTKVAATSTARTRRPRAASDAPRRPQGRGALRAHLVGRRDRRDRRALPRARRSPEGPETILPYSYAGNMGLLQYRSMDRRFFHRLGASLLDRTICASAGKAGWSAVVGASIGMDLEACVDSKLIVIWGSNAITSNLHFWTRAQEAKRRGARLVAIDPFRTATAEKCHEHIAPMPGTDAALAYGLMHVLIRDGLCDRDYVERYTVGFDALAERAREWTPERTSIDLRRAGRADRAPRARPRHDQAGGDPPQLRDAAPRRRRQRDPRGRRACPRSSARGATAPAARCSRRRAPTRSTTTRSSAPT